MLYSQVMSYNSGVKLFHFDITNGFAFSDMFLSYTILTLIFWCFSGTCTVNRKCYPW